MNEYGVVTEPRTVYFERLLPGPIERVWAYITESEKRGKWLATGEMELRVGGRVDLKFQQRRSVPKIRADARALQAAQGCADGRTRHAMRAAAPAELDLGCLERIRGHFRADAARRRRDARSDASRAPRSERDAECRPGMACASWCADRQSERPRARAVLVDVRSARGRIREADSAGLTRVRDGARI